MPGVTCEDCGKRTNVPFRRGTRLADIECSSCGATALHLPSAGRASRNRGRRYENCARCSRRGLNHGHPHFVWVPKDGTVNIGPFPIGSPACWPCEPVPSARAGWAAVSRAAELLLGRRDYDGRAGETTWAILEAASAQVPAACPVCISVGWRDGRFHTNPRLYAHGAALLGSCWRCGHTILLAAMTTEEITERGPGLLAAAAVPDPRCAAGNHDEVVAPDFAFTYLRGVRVRAGTRYCTRCGTILGQPAGANQ